ncbi:MAG TPA: CdaR family protein [Nitrospirota bacterium]
MDVRKAVLDNWGIKLLSLALSLTLWFYVTSKGKTEMTLTVPLELRNIPQNMAVVGDVAGSLEVRIQGQERQLRDVTIGKKVFGVLDLSAAREGENIVRISPDDIRRPSGVSVTHLSPAEIRVKLEPLIKKALQLKAVLRGAPARGHRMVKVIVTPPRITAEGPESAMKTLDMLQTMPIDIQGAEDSLTIEPKIDYQGKQVKIIDNKITLRIDIERTSR